MTLETFPDPETTTSDALVDLPDNETVMQRESISSREKVTILSDVKFSPYNCAYRDLTKMNSLKLNTIDKTFNIFASQNKENLLVAQVEDYTLSEPINYDNPIPSTSIQSLTISKKRRLLKKTNPDTPKKGDYGKAMRAVTTIIIPSEILLMKNTLCRQNQKQVPLFRKKKVQKLKNLEMFPLFRLIVSFW